jgi:hypothetical protein
MVWCITTRSRQPLPKEVDVDFDNPQDAARAFEWARERFGEGDLQVLRDGEEVSVTELLDASTMRHHEIHEILESETRLPAGFKRAPWGEPDLAPGADGTIPVRKPRNPEDRFD